MYFLKINREAAVIPQLWWSFWFIH